jgi:hypothetical protein
MAAVPMISMETIISQLGPQALHELEQVEFDGPALLAVRDSTAPDRNNVLRQWLLSYNVFQGIDNPGRDAIVAAILQWADRRDPERDLTTVEAITEAHVELMGVCIEAYTGTSGKRRDFTSLASKALWLCYPASVPLYDSFTQCALWVLCKFLDTDPLPRAEPQYRQFVHIWKALYQRYENTLDEIPLGNYPYRVRIFDIILWLVGKPRYDWEHQVG